MTKSYSLEEKAHKETKQFMRGLKKRNPVEPEFHQAVQEVVETLMPFVLENPKYLKSQILERMTEPDRIIIFRVCWEDDQGHIRANRAWRVQFNNSIGPYKGGMRFHPSVTLSVLKFLGFDQVFKNSLTGLPMGGGKGGVYVNPKTEKISAGELERITRRFAFQISEIIGPQKDVPAPDVYTTGKEMTQIMDTFGKLQGNTLQPGVITGKPIPMGGSLARNVATGLGTAYCVREAAKVLKMKLKGARVVLQGFGNAELPDRFFETLILTWMERKEYFQPIRDFIQDNRFIRENI